MKYSFEEITIEQLTNWVKNDKIDLNPSYQRNFIWSTKDQSELIDTILKGFPLPNFFIYEKPDGFYEMVDGQQRTTTIFNFVNGKVSATKIFEKKKISDLDISILQYKLPIIFLRDIQNTEVLNEFYVLINKKGKHLNLPEVYKSEYHDKKFLKLANELLNLQEFIDLNLFTEATSKRMNDRSFVEELLGLIAFGIKDKKQPVEDLFENDITPEQYNELYTSFVNIINVIHRFNKISPLKKTRYKQRNDFYTLFAFVKDNLSQKTEILDYQYRILLILDGNDSKGRQLIRPTNDNCPPLKEYAINCVSQSNSKKAREERLNFFNTILKNINIDKNEEFRQVLKYLAQIFGENNIGLIKMSQFELIDVNKLN